MCFWLGKYQQKINMLLAGEMLKFFFFFFFFFFENVLLAGEILKKLKMLKVGGTMFVSRVCTNIVPPTFNIFNFFRISPARSTFSKKFLTFPQPEAFSKKRPPTGEMLKIAFAVFNISPARSTSIETVFNISPARSTFAKKNLPLGKC